MGDPFVEYALYAMTVFEPGCYKLHTSWHEKASLEISLLKKGNKIFLVTARIGVHRRMKVGGPAARALAVSVTSL